MPKNKSTGTRFSPTTMMVLAGIVILIFGGWLWWTKIYNDPYRVFWGMVDNNLSTTSVTRRIQQSSNTEYEQLTRVQLSPEHATRSIVSVSQGTGASASSVNSESIGTTDSDYSRYLSISTPQKSASGKNLDFSEILGVWGKTPDTQPGQPSSAKYLQQSLLSSVVPFANLSRENRQKIIADMQQNKVYEPDFSSVNKTKLNGKRVYIFTVKIYPGAFVSSLNSIMDTAGLGPTGLDPSSYKTNPAITAQMVVDPVSRQLLEIKYSGGQEETYDGYGISVPVEIPAATIPFSDLQKKLQEAQSK